MVFFCSAVVGECGVDFGIEGTEVNFSFIYLDSGFPLFSCFVPFESLVF